MLIMNVNTVKMKYIKASKYVANIPFASIHFILVAWIKFQIIKFYVKT